MRGRSAYVVCEPVILDAIDILLHQPYIVITQIGVIWMELDHVSELVGERIQIERARLDRSAAPYYRARTPLLTFSPKCLLTRPPKGWKP